MLIGSGALFALAVLLEAVGDGLATLAAGLGHLALGLGGYLVALGPNGRGAAVPAIGWGQRSARLLLIAGILFGLLHAGGWLVGGWFALALLVQSAFAAILAGSVLRVAPPAIQPAAALRRIAMFFLVTALLVQAMVAARLSGLEEPPFPLLLALIAAVDIAVVGMLFLRAPAPQSAADAEPWPPEQAPG